MFGGPGHFSMNSPNNIAELKPLSESPHPNGHHKQNHPQPIAHETELPVRGQQNSGGPKVRSGLGMQNTELGVGQNYITMGTAGFSSWFHLPVQAILGLTRPIL